MILIAWQEMLSDEEILMISGSEIFNGIFSYHIVSLHLSKP